MRLSKRMPDIEPIAIELDGEQWLHPFIDTWFNPEMDEENGNIGLDEDVYAFSFESKSGSTLQVMAKSSYITDCLNEFLKLDNWEEQPKDACFKAPYMDMKLVFSMLELCLIEDIWSPMPKLEFDIKNSKDYARARELYPSEQFYFTPFGEKVSAFFDNEIASSHMTPDCGMWIEEETNVWGYDS